MFRYIARRLLQSLLVIFVALTVMFFIGRVLGDPVDALVTELAGEEIRQAMREELGFADPMIQQYGRFVARAVLLDFGESPLTGEPALSIILSALPNTLYLAGGILAIGLPLGLLLGATGAYRAGGWIDRLTNVIALTGISVVEFWLGLTLIMVVAVPIAAIPTGGTSGRLAVLLPALTGALRIIGRVGQFTRSALLEEYRRPYVEMARAKGVSEAKLFVHVAKNAAISVVTLSADELLGLINGVIVIEVVFGWPGVGRAVVRSLRERDLFVLEAGVFTIIVMVMVVNLTVDLSYRLLNPKVRYE